MTEPGDTTVSSAPGGGDEAYCPECNDSFTIDHGFCPNDGAKLIVLRARPDLMIGRVFDERYEVRSVLGHGGMGTVYRGWQRSVDREVAIKVIHPKLAGDRVAVKRFLREARLSSRLNQPNIINVYDFGQTDDSVLFIVMELLRGHTLVHDVEAGDPLPLKRVITIGLQLCDALEAAHNQNIIHRDLKPGNIVILDEPPGRDLVKVLDFGLAKSLLNDTSRVTHTSSMLGTPLYMPPEQVEGRDTDTRSDLYALGCILHHMATGTPPYVREHVGAVLRAHVHEPVPALPPTLPPPLAEAIHRLLQKEPEQRLQTAGAVRAALQTVADGGYRGETARVPDVATVPRVVQAQTIPGAPPPARRWLVIVIGLGLAAGAIGIVMATRGDSRGTGEVAAPVGSSDQSKPGVELAAHTPPIDASIDAAIDAAPDAARDAAIVDAPRRVDPPIRHGIRPHPAHDAGDDMPDLPFIDAGR
ncbi:MAG TPA: serine/threonine-protein kinase [Kofleriaceae bacterium]|jgi:serine/threonine-protein kinase|nr:serine/threonine-protein kinase [Kofleriaceae bacterium]